MVAERAPADRVSRPAASDAMLVVDADGHTMEPDDLWTERMDRDRWGDWIPVKRVEDEIYETVYTGGVVRGGGRELQDRMQELADHDPLEPGMTLWVERFDDPVLTGEVVLVTDGEPDVFTTPHG